MANLTEFILNLRDFNAPGINANVDAQAEDAESLAISGTAKIRQNGDILEQSINGGEWIGLGTGSALPAQYVDASLLGILPSNTATQNSDAWDAAMAEAKLGGVPQVWYFGTGTYQFERTLMIDSVQMRIIGVGGLSSLGTVFRWNSGNMTGIWIIGTNAADTIVENIRISSGGYQAYTDGRTATADGSNVITLSGSNGQLTVGRWVTINGVTTWVTNNVGTTITLRDNIPAGSGLAIVFAETYGIYSNARAHIRYVLVDGNFFAGFYAYGNVALTPPTDASSGTYTVCTGIQCTYGFQFTGPDANNIGLYNCNASANTSWGFWDNSFLGNQYYACHAENNGNPEGAFYCPSVNASCTYLGCYAEAGQNIDCTGKCAWYGGTVDSTSQFVGAMIALCNGYFVGSSPKFITSNEDGASGSISIGGDRVGLGILQQVITPARSGGIGSETFFDSCITQSFLVNARAFNQWGSSASGGSRYLTGAYTQSNGNASNAYLSYPMDVYITGFYLGYKRFQPIDTEQTAQTFNQQLVTILGNHYPIHEGDCWIETRPRLGGRLGWKCTTAGTTGSYVDGFTATGNGTTTVTLSGSNATLRLGMYITIGGTAGYIVSVSGTTLVFSVTVGAGSGLAIAYITPVGTPIGRIQGGEASTAGTIGTPLTATKGRVVIPAGSSSITVYDSLVTATSIILPVLQTSDGTLTQILRVVPSSGSFVITGNGNAAADVTVGWFIVE